MGANLNELERMAVNDFLMRHWSKFLVIAERYMDQDEIEKLEDKLDGKQ